MQSSSCSVKTSKIETNSNLEVNDYSVTKCKTEETEDRWFKSQVG